MVVSGTSSWKKLGRWETAWPASTLVITRTTTTPLSPMVFSASTKWQEEEEEGLTNNPEQEEEFWPRPPPRNQIRNRVLWRWWPMRTTIIITPWQHIRPTRIATIRMRWSRVVSHPSLVQIITIIPVNSTTHYLKDVSVVNLAGGGQRVADDLNESLELPLSDKDAQNSTLITLLFPFLLLQKLNYYWGHHHQHLWTRRPMGTLGAHHPRHLRQITVWSCWRSRWTFWMATTAAAVEEGLATTIVIIPAKAINCSDRFPITKSTPFSRRTRTRSTTMRFWRRASKDSAVTCNLSRRTSPFWYSPGNWMPPRCVGSPRRNLFKDCTRWTQIQSHRFESAWRRRWFDWEVTRNCSRTSTGSHLGGLVKIREMRKVWDFNLIPFQIWPGTGAKDTAPGHGD